MSLTLTLKGCLAIASRFRERVRLIVRYACV